eukprot:gnl/TRDRNA2_/TRDRNA2_39882_c0_seq1.p1 gnl/TRDRNA2_/TRDRNA2_39882_c0~~gnl/TRDRNA2_/TRDRNA2_39882_c0_seq1.p1  ORF type:complete len:254 (+),score=36.99 gnl/TRDRNA2_/TRDRNA2_39882_c0_seq1:61-822(+)
MASSSVNSTALSSEVQNVMEEATLCVPTPHCFLCPILTQVMNDPVATCDGHVYEREAIERWLARNDKSPMTNLPLPDRRLFPQPALKKAIQEYASMKPSMARRNLEQKSLEEAVKILEEECIEGKQASARSEKVWRNRVLLAEQRASKAEQELEVAKAARQKAEEALQKTEEALASISKYAARHCHSGAVGPMNDTDPSTSRVIDPSSVIRVSGTEAESDDYRALPRYMKIEGSWIEMGTGRRCSAEELSRSR